jgi:hypothetical protein
MLTIIISLKKLNIMKYRITILAFFLLSVSFTSCWDLLDTGENTCTECAAAMDHLAGAVNSGRLGCTQYVNSTAFAKVIAKCKDGRSKAYAIVDYYCTGYGGIPAACE